MPTKGPIIIVDSDEEDHIILQMILKQLGVKNKIFFFKDSEEALLYLKTTAEQPFLILSEIHLPKMNGLELRRQIDADERLRTKSIPFVFFTDEADKQCIMEAYQMTIQGYFLKGRSMREVEHDLGLLIRYWTECMHPNISFLH